MTARATVRWVTMLAVVVAGLGCGSSQAQPPSDTGKAAAKAGAGATKAAAETTPAMPDLATVRAQEAKTLSEYRWVDRSAGVAAIPIDRAMQILVSSGALKARTDSAAGAGGKGATSPK